MSIISCNDQKGFSSSDWKENKGEYRYRTINEIEQLEFLYSLNCKNYIDILGVPIGINETDSSTLISYKVKSITENEIEKYQEYIQIIFNRDCKFLTYNYDSWSIEKNYTRLRTIKGK